MHASPCAPAVCCLLHHGHGGVLGRRSEVSPLHRARRGFVAPLSAWNPFGFIATELPLTVTVTRMVWTGSVSLGDDGA
jgi:hypothetical protein